METGTDEEMIRICDSAGNGEGRVFLFGLNLLRHHSSWAEQSKLHQTSGSAIEVEIPMDRHDKKKWERLIRWSRLCNVLLLR